MPNDVAAANKQLVRRFYKEVYGDWNMSLVEEVVSPRFTSHDWPEGTPRGPEGFRMFYSAIRTALPDARYEVDDLISEGDKVVVRWRLLGTHEGDFRGIAPTGRAIVLKGIAIYRVEGGRLMERWVVTDLHAALESAVPGEIGREQSARALSMLPR
ncbi:MAG: ester cyclase [Gemmatimonadaceae bacterium]